MKKLLNGYFEERLVVVKYLKLLLFDKPMASF